MQANPAEFCGATDAAPAPAAVASHCFKLAEQIGGGPVRDALVAMGRDYSGRARETAQKAAFRIELAHSRQDRTGVWPFNLLAELLAPLPPRPVQRAAPAPAPQPQRAAPPQARRAAPAVARSAPSKPPQRASRLFRLHALASIES